MLQVTYIIVGMGGIWNCIPRDVDCIAVVTPWLSLLPMAATFYGYPRWFAPVAIATSLASTVSIDLQQASPTTGPTLTRVLIGDAQPR